MLHLVAYRSSVPTGSTFVYLTPVPDSQVRIESNNVIVPDGMNYLVGVYAGSGHIARARLETPSLRRNMLLEIAPVNFGGEVGLWEHFHTYKDAPLTLDNSEPMRFLAFHTHTSAQHITGLVLLGDGPVTPLVTEYFVARGVCGSVTGSGVWENVSITFDQTLPAGRYTVIGARLEHPNAIAYRLAFVGQSWRPGWLASTGVGSFTDTPVRGGKFGEWGAFPHDQPPTVDVLATGSGTAVVYLDLVRVG